MKNQFQSTESLRIRLTPFVSKVTGDYVITGTDVCTLTIEKPDGTVHTGSTVTATWDNTAKVWHYTITTGSYQQGEWRIYAVSDDANSLSKWAILYWGDYVDDITTARTAITGVDTKIGTPAGASLSADIAAAASAAGAASTAAGTAATNATTAATTAGTVNTKLGTPAGASVSADIAAVKTDALAAKSAAEAAQAAAVVSAADVAIIKKIQTGRWKINGTQLVLYELDGATEYKRFDLKDDLGNPSGTRIFERVPQ